jgi:hypothetical protein
LRAALSNYTWRNSSDNRSAREATAALLQKQAVTELHQEGLQKQSPHEIFTGGTA